MTHPFTNWQRYTFLLSTLLFCSSLLWGQRSQKIEVLDKQVLSTRRTVSLNGTWNAILDIFGRGIKKHWEHPADPANDSTKLSEVYYEGGYTLKVPGDWNSQYPELFYYTGDIWYQRYFPMPQIDNSERVILRFEAASQTATVFLNGKRLGSHVGGYTPFTFDITKDLVDGQNSLIVRVDNRLNKDQIPNHDYDWCNYGGLTRDVMLDIRPKTYIENSFIRLDPKDPSQLKVDVQLQGSTLPQQTVELIVDGLNINRMLTTDAQGHANANIKLTNSVRYWSPSDPFRYTCTFVLKNKASQDVMKEKVGLRTVQVKGSKILLNGKNIFFKGVNFHEEIARDMRRAYTPEDALFLIGEAKALGCNFVRLAHYPQNRHILEECDKQGLMVWEEVPLWQAINFKNPKTQKLGINMLHEMITRDKNRACVVIWSVGNECWPSAPRTTLLSRMADKAHREDPTRLVSYAFNNIRPTKEQPKAMVLKDELIKSLDVIGVNKYLGWYDMWPATPEETPWIMPQKPLIISEFGAAALQGNHELTHSVSGFSEEYQEKCYRDDLKSFDEIPNLCGMAPWALFDFRSPRRSHAKFQQGWNRKGLIAPDGTRKAAWSVMKEYYSKKQDVARH